MTIRKATLSAALKSNNVKLVKGIVEKEREKEGKQAFDDADIESFVKWKSEGGDVNKFTEKDTPKMQENSRKGP